MKSQILATGSYVPERIVTNSELASLMETSDTWIQKHIGVRERRFASPGEGVSDMALKAARTALKRAKLKSEDIDAIVFATSTSEFHAPGSGVLLQHKLGCRDIPAFDVRNTSPGFLYSLDLADGLIQSGRYKTILVVASEVHSTGLDFSTRGRKMAVIFGDGCGCFILQASEGKSGIQDIVLHSDGSHAKDLWCEGPSSLRNPRISTEQINEGVFYPQMNGKVVFEHAANRMSEVVRELLDRNNLTAKDIDYAISHQANLRILEAIQEKLKLCDNKMPHNIERYGNTSAASIPLLYDELVTEGLIREGQNIVFVSFGSGFCWGAALTIA